MCRSSVKSKTWHLRRGRRRGVRLNPYTFVSYKVSRIREAMGAYKGRITGIVAVALLAGIFGFAVEPSPAEASFVRCRISETVFLPTEAELAAELEGLPPDVTEGTARSGWVTVWAGTDSRCRARLRKGAVFVRETITLSIRLASEPTEAEVDAAGMNLFSSGTFATWPENQYPNDWSFGYGSGFSGSHADPEWYERYKDWADAGAGYWQGLGGRGVMESYLHSEDCFPTACTFGYEFIGLAGDVNGNLDYGYQVVLPLCGVFEEGEEPGTVLCLDGDAFPEKEFSSSYALHPFLGARVQITGELTYQVVAEYR